MKQILFLMLIILTFTLGCCKKSSPIADGSEAYKKGDYKRAAKMFMPEAKKGDAVAQLNVAFMYYCGLHYEKDFKKALKWYLKAANQNNKDAQFSVGTMFENGEGTKKNLAKAYFWYSLAEKQGDSDAKRLRKELEASFDSKQLKRIKVAIKKWKPITKSD